MPSLLIVIFVTFIIIIFNCTFGAEDIRKRSYALGDEIQKRLNIYDELSFGYKKRVIPQKKGGRNQSTNALLQKDILSFLEQNSWNNETLKRLKQRLYKLTSDQNVLSTQYALDGLNEEADTALKEWNIIHDTIFRPSCP